MLMPSFLIAGAAKSGTSALWKYLSQHPEIFMSPKKEPHFFAYENKIPASNGPGDYTKFAITDLESYKALFANVSSEKAIGEAAMTSLYVPRSVERIQYYIPQAKFIMMLRQPADRAFSSYMHLIRDNREPIQNFTEALKLEQKRIAQNWGFMWHYTQMGFYYEQVKRFFDNFHESQIRVYLHDDFDSDPIHVIRDIFCFLEVDDNFVPNMRIRVNMSGVHKNSVTANFIKILFDRPNPLRFIARKLIPHEKRWAFTASVRNRNLQHQSLSRSLRYDLTAQFREDIIRLQELIKRDLSHWLY